MQLTFSIIGGLALLLYGIHMMGDSLQKFAGDKLKEIFSSLISNRFKGVIVGTVVTAIVQSSSATSVMTVGFVSAGLMTLAQAIAVIFGANIGTTITGQLVAFKLTTFALPILAIGVILFFVSKKVKYKRLGEAIIGLGILFLGLKLMTGATHDLRNYRIVTDALLSFSTNPILGVIVGFVVTVVLQSSSATIAILIALATNNMISIEAAFPIIMGDNIGTCATALIASISSSTHAKRAALSHFLFNLAGTTVGFLLFPLYMFLAPIFSGEVTRQIANVHSMFNVVNVIIFVPFIPIFEKFLIKLLPIKDNKERKVLYLEKKLLQNPSIAIQSAIKETKRMAKLSNEMIDIVMKDLNENKIDEENKVIELEDTVDELQTEITKYLILITENTLNHRNSKKIPALLHVVNDVERIGDHAINLLTLTTRKIREKTIFSEKAKKELDIVYKQISEMMALVQKVLRSKSKSIKEAELVLEKEKAIDKLIAKYKNEHMLRLEKGDCNIKASVLFIDYLMNFEKIGDHITNIAEAKLNTLR